MVLAFNVKPRWRSRTTSGSGTTVTMKESQHLRFVRSELNKGSKGPGTSGRMDALAGRLPTM
ncbi:hypothetical protein LB505_007770 [Fusarium chuoi]|nr:hypothetical protein LB505_007770 [Fusarium chuoi]